MPDAARILYCRCAYVDVVPRVTRETVLATLRGSGVAFDAVPDLCELAARKDPLLKDIAASGPLKVVACYPRAVRSLFAAAGAPLLDEGVGFLNMREMCACGIAEALFGDEAESIELDPARPEAGLGEWIPWFPVIDASRCQNCQQCLNFCLFGVYGLSEEGHVEVQQPANCKTWCPACARVCPEVAIIFPKHSDGPINGGKVTEADLRRERVQVDLAQLVEGDVYAALRARSHRFAPDRSPEEGRAERLRRLAELREQLGIPPEVAVSLMADGDRCACSGSARAVQDESCSPRDDVDEGAGCGGRA